MSNSADFSKTSAITVSCLMLFLCFVGSIFRGLEKRVKDSLRLHTCEDAFVRPSVYPSVSSYVWPADATSVCHVST